MTFTIPRPEWVSDRLIADRGEHAGFQMFDREGNNAVGTLLLHVTGEADRLDAQRPAIIDALRNGVREVAVRFPEVHDTEPEHAITDALNAFLSERGFAQVNREELFS